MSYLAPPVCPVCDMLYDELTATESGAKVYLHLRTRKKRECVQDAQPDNAETEKID